MNAIQNDQSPFDNPALIKAVMDGGLLIPVVPLRRLTFTYPDEGAFIDGVRLRFYCNEETLDRVKAAFEWSPQARLEELFYEVEQNVVKAEFPVYSWDRIDTHPNHAQRQIGEKIYEAILELPLAAYKPWLAHPHIMDCTVQLAEDKAREFLDTLTVATSSRSGGAQTYTFPCGVSGIRMFHPVQISESFPGPASVYKGMFNFTEDEPTVASNFHWLLHQYVALRMSDSTTYVARSKKAMDYTGRKMTTRMKKIADLTLYQISPADRFVIARGKKVSSSVCSYCSCCMCMDLGQGHMIPWHRKQNISPSIHFCIPYSCRLHGCLTMFHA